MRVGGVRYTALEGGVYRNAKDSLVVGYEKQHMYGRGGDKKSLETGLHSKRGGAFFSFAKSRTDQGGRKEAPNSYSGGKTVTEG